MIHLVWRGIGFHLSTSVPCTVSTLTSQIYTSEASFLPIMPEVAGLLIATGPHGIGYIVYGVLPQTVYLVGIGGSSPPLRLGV